MICQRLLLALLTCVCLTSQTWAYSYRGQQEGESTGPTDTGEAIAWHQRQVVMGLNFGLEWNDSARLALQQWNEAGADFEWHAANYNTKPCLNDGINSTGWSDVTCGSEWGSIVATTRVSMSKIGGKWYINDTDVIFNSELQFDSYPGPMRNDEQGKPMYDFIRVALHEFGHAAGLLHPNESGQNVDSILNTGNKSLALDHLQDDDIQGIRQLYSDGQSSSLDIILDGFSSYEIDDKQISIAIDSLRSYRSSDSGELTLEIRASSSLDSASYYVVGQIGLGTLDQTEQRQIGLLTTDYTSPPTGLHSISLALLEQKKPEPLYSQAIGYLEVRSDTVRTDTLATETSSSANSDGGGGSSGSIFLLGLALQLLWKYFGADSFPLMPRAKAIFIKFFLHTGT